MIKVDLETSSLQAGSLEPFCRNRKEKRHCFKSLSDLPALQVTECPYGYSCIRVGKYALCSFAVGSFYSKKKIKGHMKNQHSRSLTLLNDDQMKMAKAVLIDDTYLQISSETAHDLINFIGNLRSLIEVYQSSSMGYGDIDEIAKKYGEYFEAFTAYESTKKRVLTDDWVTDFSLLNDAVIDRKFNHDRYKIFLEKMEDIEKRLSPLVESAEAIHLEEFERGHLWSCISLLSMESLFHFRIKYYKKLLADAEEEGTQSLTHFWKHSCHKILKKLANTMRYSANKKGCDFKFEGTNKNLILANEDFYLAIYILLENAIKYSNDNEHIWVQFDDVGCASCLLQITNSTLALTEEDMRHVKEKGYYGQNAKGKNSHGLGLYIVDKILASNGFDVKYFYNREESSFTACVLCGDQIELGDFLNFKNQ